MHSPPLSLRVLILGLFLVFAVLQARLWLSEDGWSEVILLRSSVAGQREENERLLERNVRLRAEVTDLKGGFAALEERARADLGMVAEGESFYLLVPGAGESDYESVDESDYESDDTSDNNSANAATP